MDLAKGSTGEPMLTTAALAAREDFTLGGVIVSPSTRNMRGPMASVVVEPRVMQVLVVLADAVGQVVTRETLFNRCWGGVYVGDDSLNRAVAALRRAVLAIGGRLELQAIPRTGYLLKVPKGEEFDGEEDLQTERKGARISRRGALMAGSGAATAAVLGGVGLWWANGSRTDRRFDALMARGEKAVRTETFDEQTVQVMEDAVRLRPDSAKAWGLLAFMRSVLAQGAAPKDSGRAIEAAENAARKALAIDPKEPNALLAMFELQGSTLDWATRDQKLRQIIGIDPNNVGAIAELVLLLQAAGLTRESWNWNERALTLEPLSVDFLSKRALKLWILEHMSQADKVIDQVRALYPTNPGSWWVRFLIFALTDRPRAAQAMLDADPSMMPDLVEASFWRSCLVALDRRSPETIATARDACVNGAKALSAIPGQAVMILSALGEVDTAFDVCNGFLLSRGSIVHRGEPGSKDAVNDAAARINTQWLFTPPAASMRADPRFLPLCDAMGLAEYWRTRHVVPDFMQKRS